MIGGKIDIDLKLGLEYTKEFIKLLIEDENLNIYKSIEILPNELFNENKDIQNELKNKGIPILSIQNELIISKDYFGRIFLESYQFIYKASNQIKITEYNYKDIRIATFGLLFTTPLDTTALRLNFECLKKYNSSRFILQTYFIIGNFLQCNYERTNKSSCLWKYFQKLHVLVNDLITNNDNEQVLKEFHIKNGDKVELFKTSINICLNSIKVHPMNYYACNSIRFFMANSYIQDIKYEDILGHLVEKSKGLSVDYSLWISINDSVIDLVKNNLDYYRLEWNKNKNNHNNNNNQFKLSHNLEYLNEIFQDIFEYGKSIGSYNMLLVSYIINYELEFTPNFQYKFKEFFEEFENKYQMKINCSGGCLIDFNNHIIDLNKDLLLRDEFKKAISMKRVWEFSINFEKIIGKKDNIVIL